MRRGKVCGYFAGLVMVCVGQVSAQSTLLVSDSNGAGQGTNGDKVVRFSYDGTSAEMINHFASQDWSPLTNSTSMVQKADGNILVASFTTNSILEYDSQTGQYLGEFIAPGVGGLDGPIDMAFGPDGNLWVTSKNSNRLIKLNGTTGALLNSITLNVPRGIALNPVDGFLYVVISGNQVVRVDPLRNVYSGVAIVGGLLNAPHDVIFRPDGGMYISNFDTNSIVTVLAGSVPPSGQPQQYGGMMHFVFPAQYGMDRPIGMVLDEDGGVLVVERGAGRVLRFIPGAPFGPNIGSSIVVNPNEGGLGGGYSLLLYDPPVEPEPCIADINGDGALNFFDVSAFLAAFSAGCP